MVPASSGQINPAAAGDKRAHAGSLNGSAGSITPSNGRVQNPPATGNTSLTPTCAAVPSAPGRGFASFKTRKILAPDRTYNVSVPGSAVLDGNCARNSCGKRR